MAAQGALGIRSILLAGKRMGILEVGADRGHTSARSPGGDLAWPRRFQHVAVLVAVSCPPNSSRRLKKVACALAACETGGSPVAAEAVDAAPTKVKVRKVSFT